MQHATVQNFPTELEAVPVTKENLEGDDVLGLHINEMDKTISIIQRQPNDEQLPPTEIAHGLSEPKISDTNDKLVTKTTTAKMPHSSASCGDAIDCAMVARNEANSHELTPALKGSPIVYENNLQLTPTEGDVPYHKDGHYFLALLKTEQTRLLAMAEQAERDMYTLSTNKNNEISEEILGILRSVSGKTKLLVSQKLKQFEGLCYSNLNPKVNEKFPTTEEDLQGFWDMVNLQIEHIDSLFKEIGLLKSNNWQKTKDNASPFVPSGTKLMKRPIQKNSNSITPVKTSPNALLMAQKREAQRKQLLELKRKNKNAAADRGALSSPIEIYVHENFV